MKTNLKIEDDRRISELLCMKPNQVAGYETVAAYDGIEAQRLLLWNGKMQTLQLSILCFPAKMALP